MLTFVGQSANDEMLARVVSKLFSYFSSGGRVFKLSDHAMYTDCVLSSQQSHDALKHAFGSRQFSKGGGGGGGGVGGGVRLYNKYGTSNMWLRWAYDDDIRQVSLLYLILKLFQYILSSVKKIKHSNIEYNHYVNKAQRSL